MFFEWTVKVEGLVGVNPVEVRVLSAALFSSCFTATSQRLASWLARWGFTLGFQAAILRCDSTLGPAMDYDGRPPLAGGSFPWFVPNGDALCRTVFDEAGTSGRRFG